MGIQFNKQAIKKANKKKEYLREIKKNAVRNGSQLSFRLSPVRLPNCCKQKKRFSNLLSSS